MDLAVKQSLSSEVQRHSPCIGVCKLDEETGLCLGCARTRDEIASWPSLDVKARLAVWEELPARHAAQAKRVRLLPLTPDEILAWAAQTIEKRLGGWSTGMPGAVAEFMAATDETPTTELKEYEVIGRTNTAFFRLRRHDQLRAFACEEGGPIVLGAAKAAIGAYANSAITRLGFDVEAGTPDFRGHLLFDYGLGRKFSRFCIRTNTEALIAALRDFEGQPWQALMAAAGSRIIAESPHRVVESSLARIEVYAPIPEPSGRSPDGAHTHFLPAFLAAEEEISPSLALPEKIAPVAIFHPSRRQTA